MGLEYLTAEDLILRLDHSICRYKGIPYYVRVARFDKKNFVNIYKLTDKYFKAPMEVDYTSDDFDYTAPPLGYMTYGKEAYYVARMPNRRQNQGLQRNDLLITPLAVDNNWFMHKSMISCITGEHMHMKHALRLVQEEGNESCSVHRHFAIKNGLAGRIYLEYRTRPISIYCDGKWPIFPGKDSTVLMRVMKNSGAFEDGTYCL